jgi:hypothetical protein
MIEPMAAPNEILNLMKRFDDNVDAYCSAGYNEAAARIEFIDPLCKCLGWDMDNTQGFAEAYKDVIHEDAIKISGVTKAPDYCFRVGGTRRFFSILVAIGLFDGVSFFAILTNVDKHRPLPPMLRDRVLVLRDC